MARPATGQVVEKTTARGRSYALRFRAYGQRHYLTLGTTADGWNRQRAEEELANVLADVRRGTWRPPTPVVVDVPVEVPTFHEFASEWFAAKRLELAANTVRNYRNDLTRHLLPFFAQHRLDQITVAEVDRYRNAKVREGDLKPRTINMTLALLAQILEVAVEYGHLDRNPAAGRRRRLKAPRPRPVHLDTADQMRALLDAARELDGGKAAQTEGRRACLAVLLFAGLRAEEVGRLQWRDVDLANGRLKVGRSKTAAGVREIPLLPILRDELTSHKLASRRTRPSDLVFTTSTGQPRDRHNVRQRVLAPAVIRRADELLEQRDRPPLPQGLSPHKLRHSFASLLVALGTDMADAMAQLGHTDPAFTLRVYTHMMRRDQAERDRLRALVEGADWAPMGTESPSESVPAPVGSEPEQQKTPPERGFHAIGAPGFEPGTSPTRTVRATRLRHAPKTEPQ
jgi:integrase